MQGVEIEVNLLERVGRNEDGLGGYCYVIKEFFLN